MQISYSNTSIVEVAYNWPVETFIQRHLKAMQDNNVNVHLIARHGNVGYASGASIAQNIEGLSGQVMPNFDHLSIHQKIWNLRYLRFGNPPLSVRDRVLLGYFEHLQPDLIHFHDASLAASMKWIPTALAVPYTVSLRGSDIQVLPNRSIEQKNNIISALENAKKIHAVCNQLGNIAKKLSKNQQLDVQTIYTTVPIPDKLPRWFGTKNQDELHFVASGRLMWQKGFPQLLLALRHLLDRGERVKLTLVGTGPEIDFILYMRNILNLEAHVTLAGRLNYEEISQLLSNAHGYVQSSVAEGLSNALVEAMANGVPVFATDVDGTREIIQDGISGFLLPPFQSEKWDDILIKAKDVKLMELVRCTAYQKSRECFSSQKHAQDFIQFYQQALNG